MDGSLMGFHDSVLYKCKLLMVECHDLLSSKSSVTLVGVTFSATAHLKGP